MQSQRHPLLEARALYNLFPCIFLSCENSKYSQQMLAQPKACSRPPQCKGLVKLQFHLHVSFVASAGINEPSYAMHRRTLPAF